MTIAPAIDIRRSADRFHTRAGWLDSKHSFSFGGHYSPDNTHHGQLLVLNDDRVAGGTGFDTHPHRDMEIVTWVLDGELEHKDSEGNRGLIYPGLAQRMSAGRGIWHSEKNGARPTRCTSSRCGSCPTPSRSTPAISSSTSTTNSPAAGSVPIASGQGHDAAISIHQRDAVLWGAQAAAGRAGRRFPAPRSVTCSSPAAACELESNGELATGDAVRLHRADGDELIAGGDGAEVLIWTTGAMR